MERETRIVADAQQLARAAAEEFTRQAILAVKSRGRFSVALSGGSTPKVMYSLLAQDTEFSGRIPWDQIHFFFGDERFVPSDSEESNYRMVNEALFSHVSIPAENIHRVKTELSDAHETAVEYRSQIAETFGIDENALPKFDLVLLGMGPDGHTASLFPGSDALSETHKTVVENWVAKFDMFRITFTLPLINSAANVVFIVGGHDKAAMIARVFGTNSDSEKVPCQLVNPADGKLLWLLDKDAAAQING